MPEPALTVTPWRYVCPGCGAIAGEYPIGPATRGRTHLVHVPHQPDCEAHNKFLAKYPHWPRKGWFAWHRKNAQITEEEATHERAEQSRSHTTNRNRTTQHRPTRTDANLNRP